MNINKIWGEWVGGRAAWGLLAIRVVFGGALVLHGMQKMGAPTTWMNAFGPSAPPAPLQFLAFFAEFGGGLALLFGLLTPLAALGVMFEMAVALLMVHAAHPWVAGPGQASKEGALGYFVFALLMLLAGPGKLSLDALLFGRQRAATPGEVRAPLGVRS